MDKQVFEGKFSEISGAFKQKFANLNLSDAELRSTDGDFDKMVDLVCQKMGVSREEAKKKVEQALTSLNFNASPSRSFTEKVSQKFEELKSKFIH